MESPRGGEQMSEWYVAKLEDIEISEDDKMIDVYVKHNDFGAVYVEVPISFILDILSKRKLMLSGD